MLRKLFQSLRAVVRVSRLPELYKGKYGTGVFYGRNTVVRAVQALRSPALLSEQSRALTPIIERLRWFGWAQRFQFPLERLRLMAYMPIRPVIQHPLLHMHWPVPDHFEDSVVVETYDNIVNENIVNESRQRHRMGFQ